MRYGDPQLDREVRAENRKSGRRRRNLLIAVAGVIAFVLAFTLVAAMTTPVSGESPPSPSALPSPSAPVDLDDVFPTATEISEAIGAEVEARGVESDLSQLWEGVDLDPSAMDARMQVYGLSDDVTGEMLAMALIDVVRFRDAADALASGEDRASSITGPLENFETELSADLVAASSWASDDGFGGSTVVARQGPDVIIVTVAKAGAQETAAASETVTALVLDRLGDG